MSNKYEWSMSSAARKFSSGVWITVGDTISVSKQITRDCDRERDAYRNCKNCGRHYNYHKNGNCPN